MAAASADPYRPPDTPSGHTRDSTESLVGVVDTSLVAIALEVEGVSSVGVAAVGGEAVVAVTRDDRVKVEDGNGGVPCRKAGEIPDHLQNIRHPLKYLILMLLDSFLTVIDLILYSKKGIWWHGSASEKDQNN